MFIIFPFVFSLFDFLFPFVAVSVTRYSSVHVMAHPEHEVIRQEGAN